MDVDIEMILKPEEVKNSEAIINQIDAFINSFNLNSEIKDREDGVIHNWKRSLEENILLYEIDIGSAGFVFLKKVLRYLSKLNCFLKVEVS